MPVRLQREPSGGFPLVERFWTFHRLAVLPIRRCCTTTVDQSINVASKEICRFADCFADLSHIPQIAYGVSEARGVGFEVDGGGVLGLTIVDFKSESLMSLL